MPSTVNLSTDVLRSTGDQELGWMALYGFLSFFSVFLPSLSPSPEVFLSGFGTLAGVLDAVWAIARW